MKSSNGMGPSARIRSRSVSTSTPASGDDRGNLFEPPQNLGRTRGGVDGRVFEHSVWSQMQQNPLLSLGAAAVVGAAIALISRD